MSSSQRSSSGVRNLRALFENQDSTDSLSPSRGRSPAGSIGGSSNTDRSPAPSIGTRKVRASFVSVEPSGREFNGTGLDPSSLNRRTIASQMSSAAPLNDAGAGQVDGSNPSFQANVIPTPLVDIANPPSGQEGEEMVLPTREFQSEHLEKNVSSVEDQEAELQPADVTDENVVATGAEELSQTPNISNGSPGVLKSTTTPKSSGLPANAHPSSKAIPASKSSKAANVSPPSAKPHVKGSTKPVRLSSHLMQPTASSAAKHEPEAEPATTKPRPTSLNHKPHPLSSHLMAPTAASKAKHEADPAPRSPQGQKIMAKAAAIATKRERSGQASSSTQAAASRKAPGSSRSSLARASNGATYQQPQPTTSSKPPSGDFLSRLMKPTTASSSKTHEKTEIKSPPHPKPAAPASKAEHAAKSARSSTSKSSTASPVATTKPQEQASKSSSAQQPISTALAESSVQVEPRSQTAAVVSEEQIPSPAPTPVAALTQEASSPKPTQTETGHQEADSSAEQWNPAALPRTPQSKTDNPLDLAAEEIAAAGQDKSKAAADPGRRSMMETPELEGATIH